MQLTRAADYGVRVMIHLASDENSARASLTDLAAAAEVSPAFLSKVLQRLVRAGLVASRRGKHGGFEIVERGRRSSLLDILRALEGVPELNVCLLSGGCHRSPTCPAHPVWREVERHMHALLSDATLDRLVANAHEREKAGAS
ncbi:MAG TPA: Rrf2 family transcriptional regulator [Vicinamibacterales bacterium]|jgi:Rrf2 family protein